MLLSDEINNTQIGHTQHEEIAIKQKGSLCAFSPLRFRAAVLVSGRRPRRVDGLLPEVGRGGAEVYIRVPNVLPSTPKNRSQTGGH